MAYVNFQRKYENDDVIKIMLVKRVSTVDVDDGDKIVNFTNYNDI